jgi:hypothetical protein
MFGSVNANGSSRDVELVGHLGVWKRVERVTTVAEKIVKLRGLIADEDVEAAIGDHGTYRMHARAAVLAHSRQVAEPDLELVDQRPACFGQFGSFACELIPALRP